ncbi:hypothetical protein ETH_00038730, partial [Eimeria tenella]
RSSEGDLPCGESSALSEVYVHLKLQQHFLGLVSSIPFPHLNSIIQINLGPFASPPEEQNAPQEQGDGEPELLLFRKPAAAAAAAAVEVGDIVEQQESGGTSPSASEEAAAAAEEAAAAASTASSAALEESSSNKGIWQ